MGTLQAVYAWRKYLRRPWLSLLAELEALRKQAVRIKAQLKPG